MAWDTEGPRRRLKEAATAEFAEHGPDGTTMAITRSPIRRSVGTSSPIWSSTPATSMPGTYGGGMSVSCWARAPLRIRVSVGLTAAARTRMVCA